MEIFSKEKQCGKISSKRESAHKYITEQLNQCIVRFILEYFFYCRNHVFTDMPDGKPSLEAFPFCGECNATPNGIIYFCILL